MADVEKKLLGRFYQEFWVFLILILLLIFVLAVLIVYYLIKFKKATAVFRVVIPIVEVGLTILLCMLGKVFLSYQKDYLYIKSNVPLRVEGTVIGYSVTTVSGDDLTTTKSWPIIMTKGANEKMSLNVIKAEEKLTIGQDYQFLYLPNTKIADVVENIK